MNTRGALSIRPQRRLRLVAAIAILWLALVVTLASWWVSIVIRQSTRIAELELATGVAPAEVSETRAVTRRMIVWESGAFMLLLVGLSGSLMWLYWRDHLRARATQGFFAAVTHELRTPLTSVRLQAEAIAEGGQGPELAARLLADTHRLESQIDKTLELARIEGGGALAEQEIPLEGWLERTLRTIAETHGERVQLAVTLPAELPPILADAAAVQMILRNLVENSVRHARVTPVQVAVQAAAARAHVTITYRDDGHGSTEPAAQLGRLFLRGAQSSGTGVGLYLVRGLMQRMGGTVAFRPAAQATPEARGFEVQLTFRASEEHTP